MRRITLILLALLLPMTAGATTFYVDAAATGAANGTSWTDAWTTLTAAEAGASTGDTVLVLAGTYSEAAQLALAKGITWEARANTTATTIGSATVTSAEVTDNALVTISDNTTKSFTGFTFDCSTIRSQCISFAATQAAPVTFTTCSFTTAKTAGTANYAIYSADYAGPLTLTDCTFAVHDGGYWSRTIYWRGGSGAKAAPSMTMTGGTLITGVTYGISYHVDGTGSPTCTLDGVAIIVGQGTGIDFMAAGTFVMEDCTVTTSGTYTGLLSVAGATTATVTVEDNTITMGAKSAGDLIVAQSGGTKTITVKDNTFTTSTTAGQSGKALVRAIDQAGVRVVGNDFTVNANSTNSFNVISIETSGVNTAYYAYIAGNTFTHYDTNSLSIAVGSNASTAMQSHYAIIEGNLITGIAVSSTEMIDHHGILVGNCIGAQVRNNTVIGAGYGVVIKGTNATSDWAFHDGIHHNLFVDCAKAAILFKGVINCPAEHNTIVNNRRTAAYSPAGENGQIWQTPNGAGVNSLTNRVRYNILYNHNADIPYVRFTDANQTLESINWNCYWGDSTWEIGASSYATLALWQAVNAAYDPNSLFRNPRFRDLASDDYRLTWRSPCINPYSTSLMHRTSAWLFKEQYAWGAYPPYLESLRP